MFLVKLKEQYNCNQNDLLELIFFIELYTLNNSDHQ